MANQKYTAEFRDEAVWQVLDRGFSVKEVSENLGGSTHSLYKWLKGVRPAPEKRRDEIRSGRRANDALYAVVLFHVKDEKICRYL